MVNRVDASRGSKGRQRTRRREPLSRREIQEVALRLIDEDGLEVLTVRRLGGALGVDPMALYRHFENKEALLDGVAELLWEEVERGSRDGGDWKHQLRSIASSLRDLAHAHPNAYSLVMTREVMPEAALSLSEAKLKALKAAGFEEDLAAQAVRTLVSYGVGYGAVELSYLLSEDQGSAESASEVERLMRVMRMVPRDVPPHLAEVARIICDCDVDAQFDFGLEVVLTGLEAMLNRSPADTE